MSARAAVATWTLALLAASATAVVVVGSGKPTAHLWTLALTIPTGLAFVASGLVVKSRRPESRIGPLLLAVGFATFPGALRDAESSVLFTAGQALQWLYFGFLVHVVMAFPSGRLATTTNRAVVVLAYALGLLMLPALMVVDAGHHDCHGAGCPDNLLAVAPSHRVGEQLERFHFWALVSVAAVVVTQVVRRWVDTRAALRRAVTPVFASFTALMVVLAAQHIAEAHAAAAFDATNWLLLGALLTIPIAFLFGLFRSRFGSAMQQLVLELSAAPIGGVREALARALRDPSLDVAYPTASGAYVDLAGKPVNLPEPGGGREAKLVSRNGRPIAAITHDESLAGDPLLEAATAAAGLALDNERLQAELRSNVDELRASRARLVRATDDARRNFERNLHDGAQQRLVTLSLALRIATAKLREDPDAAERMLVQADEDLDRALEELRELARGLHPAILTDRGLAAALEALARRAPLPVELKTLPDRRLPQEVEVASFYVVSEALTNVAKYASASFVEVSVDARNGSAIIEVRDDGVGGADPGGGSGLRGLTDRVEALDGHLHITSEQGSGTLIRAVIPCGETA